MSLTPFEFRAPRMSKVGREVAGQVGTAARDLGGTRALVVGDATMERAGYVDAVERALAGAGIASARYAGVNTEPTDAHCEEGLAVLRESGADVVVAVGGGSPIDTAKAVAALATNPGAIADFRGTDKIARPRLPLVAIPTTAGTGSEVTRFTVITDRHTHVKMLITSDRLIPDVALVDPLLTVSCPKSVTAASGLDALTHAIEAFISRRANPISDGFAINAMGRIARFFRRAYERGDDLEAREQMLLGALEAGLAFSNASVALVHGMARPIGAYFGIAHGLSNAMLLPHVMEYTFDTATERFAEIARALGEPTDGLSVESAARRAVTAVQQLCRDLSVPTLVAAGVDGRRVSELAAQMAEDALASGSPGNNPRVPTTDEIVALYLRAL